MADEIAYQMALKGTEALRSWYITSRKEVLDLSGADLSDCDLRWMNFAGANLENVNFSNAALTGAYFGPSEFRYKEKSGYENYRNVNLKNSNFTNAILLAATFNFAILDDSVFNNSYLALSNFRGIDFKNVSFYQSKLLKSSFQDCRFTTAKHINSIIHLGPSSIDFDSLLHSKNLPEGFFKQIGLPQLLIDYLPDFLNADNPINFHSCFISHSSADKEFCNKLYYKLVSENIRTWYAPEDMEAGKKIYHQITKALNSYDKLIIILSENSISSSWVKNEIKLTREREKLTGTQLLFPISLISFSKLQMWKLIDEETGEDIAAEIRSYYIPDFSDWVNQQSFQVEIEKLVRALRRKDK